MKKLIFYVNYLKELLFVPSQKNQYKQIIIIMHLILHNL
jgi:hypothetical protein